MSSQESATAYPAIPAAVARTLAQSGLQLTPELARELSMAMVDGSGSTSANDNTVNTATTGGTRATMVARDNGVAAAAANPCKVIGGVRHWLAIPRCKACEAEKRKCWKPRVGKRCAACTAKGAICRSAVKATPQRAQTEATVQEEASLRDNAGAGTSGMNVDVPEHPPEVIDVDSFPSPAPVPQSPEPIDVDPSPSPAPVPQPLRRGPPRAARPAPPIQSAFPIPRSPQAPPADDYYLLRAITQKLRLMDRSFADEIESRHELLSGLQHYREEVTEEREHATAIADMERVVLGHFASTVPVEPAGSTSERDGSPEVNTEEERAT